VQVGGRALRLEVGDLGTELIPDRAGQQMRRNPPDPETIAKIRELYLRHGVPFNQLRIRFGVSQPRLLKILGGLTSRKRNCERLDIR
jgi:hypothetical protein